MHGVSFFQSDRPIDNLDSLTRLIFYFCASSRNSNSDDNGRAKTAGYGCYYVQHRTAREHDGICLVGWMLGQIFWRGLSTKGRHMGIALVKSCFFVLSWLGSLHVNGFLVSKETVVLRRWESERKIWFYQASSKKVELPPWKIEKADVSSVSPSSQRIFSDKGLTLKTLAF